MHKRCSRCERDLPLTEFNKRKRSKDGLCMVCRSCSAEKNRIWRQNNPDGFRKWASKNKESRAEYMAAWHEANRGYRSRAYREWRENNRSRVAERVARRYAAKLRATPIWADVSKIIEFYEEARRLTRETGVKHEVDHFYPLRGEAVCGLHVETNLRVVTRAENARKKNRMPRETL